MATIRQTEAGGPDLSEAPYQNLDGHDRPSEFEPTPGTIWASPLCHPRFRLHRYIALFFMCCMGFGKFKGQRRLST